MSRARNLLTAVVVALLAVVGGACSDDELDSVADEVGNVASTVADAAQDVSARSVAEAYRAALLADDGADGPDRRRIQVLQETSGDLPGEPEVQGIEDGNGDGLDDDGRVELRVDDQSSCLLIAEDGELNIEDC